MWQEYRAFLLRGNLLDLAVAFILGIAFNAVVQAFAEDVVMGLIAALFGYDGVEELAVGPVQLAAFVGAIIWFVIVATVLFAVVRAAGAVQRRPPEETLVESDEAVLLREIRDLLTAQPSGGR